MKTRSAYIDVLYVLPCSQVSFFGLLCIIFSRLAPFFTLLALNVCLTSALPAQSTAKPTEDSRQRSGSISAHAACFPALDFTMPSNPPGDTSSWWCSPNNEYAFLGFSYEVTSCKFLTISTRRRSDVCHTGQSKQQLQKEFADIRNGFKSRYVRLYGATAKAFSSYLLL